MRIQVSADVGFDRVERTVETVDPERQVIATEQRAEIIPGAEGGAGLDEPHRHLHELAHHRELPGRRRGSVKRLSVAVLLNERVPTGDGAGRAAWTPEQIDRVQALVTTAVGLDPARGDEISVVSIPFDAPFQEEPVDVWTLVETFHKPAPDAGGAAARLRRGPAGAQDRRRPPPRSPPAPPALEREESDDEALGGRRAAAGAGAGRVLPVVRREPGEQP